MRVFVPSDDAPADVSGIVQHVASGRSTPFRGEGELLWLLCRSAAAPSEQPPAHNEERRQGT